MIYIVFIICNSLNTHLGYYNISPYLSKSILNSYNIFYLNIFYIYHIFALSLFRFLFLLFLLPFDLKSFLINKWNINSIQSSNDVIEKNKCWFINETANSSLLYRFSLSFCIFIFLNIHHWFNIINIFPNSPDDGSLELKYCSTDFASE